VLASVHSPSRVSVECINFFRSSENNRCRNLKGFKKRQSFGFRTMRHQPQSKNDGSDSFCRACRHLPFRDILKLLAGDKSACDTFLWVSPTPSHIPKDRLERPQSTNDTLKKPFIAWHEHISHLQEHHEQCNFCSVIFHFLQHSHVYHAQIKSGEKVRLWLHVPFLRGSPLLTVYIGQTQPETRISGNYQFTTTPGNSSIDVECDGDS